MAEAGKFFMYKNKPLLRSGNVIYYGNMSDKFVVKIDILKTQMQNNLEMAVLASVQLLNTDPTVDIFQKIAKNCEKNSLYEALDIASAWLEHANG